MDANKDDQFRLQFKAHGNDFTLKDILKDTLISLQFGNVRHTFAHPKISGYLWYTALGLYVTIGDPGSVALTLSRQDGLVQGPKTLEHLTRLQSGNPPVELGF